MHARPLRLLAEVFSQRLLLHRSTHWLGILFRLRHGRCVVAFTAKQRVCGRTQQHAPRGDSSRDGSSGHQELDDIERERKTDMAPSNQNQQGGRDQGGNQGGRDQGGRNQGDTSNRGFASMDDDKQRAIAAEGGRAAHAQGTAHEFDSEEAREAGRKGGEVRAQNADRDEQGQFSGSGDNSRGSQQMSSGQSSSSGGRGGNQSSGGSSGGSSSGGSSGGRNN
jgi:hypothetical protein